MFKGCYLKTTLISTDVAIESILSNISKEHLEQTFLREDIIFIKDCLKPVLNIICDKLS
jgi:hypothetical protein